VAGPDVVTAPRRALRSDGQYLRYWVAGRISNAGSMITSVVLPVLMYRRTGSPLETSVLVALETIPYLVFGLFAGAIADRMDRRRLMWGCELASAALAASIPVASLAGRLTVAQMLVVAAGLGTTFVWFDSASFAALPALAGRDRIVAARSSISAADSISTMAGPAVGGILAATIGPANAMTLDAASYVVSALLLTTISRPLSAPAAARQVAALRRIRADIAEGLRYLWRQHQVRALTLMGTASSIADGAVLGLLVVYANRQLGLPRTSVLIGVLYAAGGLGAFAGSVALPALARRVPVPAITLAGNAARLGLLVGFALTRQVAAALVLYAALASPRVGGGRGARHRSGCAPGSAHRRLRHGSGAGLRRRRALAPGSVGAVPG
jgi:MFS family permease